MSPQVLSGQWWKAFPFIIRSNCDPDRYQHFIDAWKDTLAAVAKAGVKFVCYNFMPVVDWTRTDLIGGCPLQVMGCVLMRSILRHTTCLFSDAKERERIIPRNGFGRRRPLQIMSDARKDELERTIIAGLPGAEASYDRETIRGLDR